MNLLSLYLIMSTMFLRSINSFYHTKSAIFNKQNFKTFVTNLDYQTDNKLNTNMFYRNINIDKFLFPITKPSFSRIRNKIIHDFQYKLFFDGFTENGNSGSGAVIFKNNMELWSNKEFVGKNSTNIYAQYKGLNMGLRAAAKFNIKVLLVKSDCELIQQLNNKMTNVDCIHLLNLYKETKQLEKRFDTVEYIHIDKELNNQAFNLANNAVKEYLSYIIETNEPFISDK